MKHFVRKKVCTVLLVMGICFLASPLSLLWSQTETLRMLVWEPYTQGEHRQIFIRHVKEKFNIDLNIEVKYVSSDDDFLPALRDMKTDIIVASHNAPKDRRFNLIRHKLLVPVNPEHIANYPNIVPSMQKGDYCTENGEVYAVPVAYGPYGLAFNTAVFPEAPDSWNVFWDPKFKGRYALGKDQYEPNVYFTALAMGMSAKEMHDYTKLNTPDFQKRLAELAVNAAVLWEGIDRAEEMKGLALAAVWGTSLPGLKEMGEIWKMAEPKEGSTAWMDNFMISHTLKNNPVLRKIAEEWINYTLSDAYQTDLVRKAGFCPVTTTVKDHLTPEEVAALHLDDADYFRNHRILWPTLEKTDRKGMKRLWDMALEKRK